MQFPELQPFLCWKCTYFKAFIPAPSKIPGAIFMYWYKIPKHPRTKSWLQHWTFVKSDLSFLRFGFATDRTNYQLGVFWIDLKHFWDSFRSGRPKKRLLHKCKALKIWESMVAQLKLEGFIGEEDKNTFLLASNGVQLWYPTVLPTAFITTLHSVLLIYTYSYAYTYSFASCLHILALPAELLTALITTLHSVLHI